ncbi:MAG: GNAT family N-acetyltransferase [Clostridium sp.]
MIEYRRANINDIDELVSLRINQLRDEGAEENFDLAPALYDFYVRHFNDGSFVSWVGVDDGRIIATSGMSFMEKPPYFSNPTGRIGLLSSMYTLNDYRRRGIGKFLLGKVIEEARVAGCGVVQLTASDTGVLLYSDFGFERKGNFMQFVIG